MIISTAACVNNNAFNCVAVVLTPGTLSPCVRVRFHRLHNRRLGLNLVLRRRMHAHQSQLCRLGTNQLYHTC